MWIVCLGEFCSWTIFFFLMCLPLTEKVDDRFLKRHLLWHFWGRVIWDNREWRWSGVCVSIMKQISTKWVELRLVYLWNKSIKNGWLFWAKSRETWKKGSGTSQERPRNVPGSHQEQPKYNAGTTQETPDNIPGTYFRNFFCFSDLKMRGPTPAVIHEYETNQGQKKARLGIHENNLSR